MNELMETLQTHRHWINESITTCQDKYFKPLENSRGGGRGRNGFGSGSRSRGHGRNGQRIVGAESLGRISNQTLERINLDLHT